MITRVLSLAATVCLVATLGCGRNSSEGSSGDVAFPRSQTLYVGGFQWGPPVSFNPLHGSPAWPITGNMNLIYEALFGYNMLTGKIEGILARDYELKDRQLTVWLNSAARWHDGTPLTAADVAYTFDVHRTYHTPFHSHWNFLDGVRAVNDTTVMFELSTTNYNPLVAKDIIAATPILPRAVFSALEDSIREELGAEGEPAGAEIYTAIREFRNDSMPLGSGPYTLHTYSDQKIVLKRVDSYWGNVLHGGAKPAPTYLIHASYRGNDKFNLALQQGNLDISQTFCPQIWNKFNKGVGTWSKEAPYYVPGIIPALLVNLTKEPLGDPAFRRAVAHAIDYDKIRRLAIYGYAPKLRPGLILPFGTEAEYFSKEDAEAYGVSYDPKKARRILENAGYSWGEEGLLVDPDGNPIPTLYASCPSGWTDWEATIRITVASMREVGIDVREKFVEYPIWDKELKNCLFDFTMKTPQPESSPSLPWARFDKVMSSKQWAPPGEVMYENEGRYRNAAADSLLRLLPALTDTAAIKKTYRDLNVLFMKELPVIPLMYRPWLFYQFSTRHWTNYPTEENPYAPPQCLMVGAGVKALWGIRGRE